MRRKLLPLILIISIVVFFGGSAGAAIPTFDAMNAALNQIRNAILQTQFAKEIALAIQRLEQLRATYLELIRFHAGWDEVIDAIVGDPLGEIVRKGRSLIRDTFSDLEWIGPDMDRLENAYEPQEIGKILEELTGPMPDSFARPYIPFEEMQVVGGFQMAQEIRKAGDQTRRAARRISAQAKVASPKGAARLGAQALSQIMVLNQQNQEALAKVIELEATQVEQVSRDEKRYERERLRYMEEFQRALEAIGRSA